MAKKESESIATEVVETKKIENPTVAKKSNKTVIIIVAVLAGLLLLCCGCCGVLYATGSITSRLEELDKKNLLPRVDDPYVTTTPKPTSTKTYAIGDTATIDEIEVSVASAEAYTSDNLYFLPSEGYHYVAIEVAITNTSSVDYQSSSLLNFRLFDSAGYEYDLSLVGKEPSFSGGTIQPSKTGRGFITFEVSDEAEDLQLSFKPRIVASDEITFDLGNVK